MINSNKFFDECISDGMSEQEAGAFLRAALRFEAAGQPMSAVDFEATVLEELGETPKRARELAAAKLPPQRAGVLLLPAAPRPKN